ncbi:MAG TPA: hypothetical protein VFX47_01510 [Gammaproteobacteria bacterium]|nr:hypothetical protein [Gammaproteobacteria bacterium]
MLKKQPARRAPGTARVFQAVQLLEKWRKPEIESSGFRIEKGARMVFFNKRLDKFKAHKLRAVSSLPLRLN